MVALVTLSLLASMMYATRFAPTADEMQASFDNAQKFYSSGAYDQAIERYQHIIASESRFLDADSVRVTVGDITAPLREIAPYQIGNAHLKMAEEALSKAARTRDKDKRAVFRTTADSLLERAASYFLRTESLSSVAALKALARSQAVTCHYKRRAYNRAIEDARVLIERYPDSKYVDKALYDIGWCYYDQDKYRESIAAFRDLVEQFETGYRVSRALFQIGEAYFKLEEYASAIPYYQRLVESQRIGQMSQRELLQMQREKIAGLVDETALELAAKALIRTGVCYEKTGEYEKAAQAFETVATQFADERRLAEEAYLRQADMQYNRGDFEACIAVYRQAIEAESDPFRRARMQLLLANRYFETEHYPEAVREYNVYRDNYEMRAAQAGLSVEGAGLKIARAWFKEAAKHPEAERLDYYRRAEAELRQTLSKYPGSDYEIELRFNLGLALQMQDDPAKTDESLELFRSVANARDPKGYRQSALFQVARALHGREELDAAATAYHTILDEVEPDEHETQIARFELSTVERDAGQWQQAVERFRTVGKDSRLYGRSRLEAGQTLLQHDRVKAAIDVFKEGLAEADSSLGQYLTYFIGASYSRLGEHERALEYFDRAVAAADSSLYERALYGRGSTAFRLKRYEQVIQDLKRDWHDPELAESATRLLAAAYTSLNRIDEALALYERLAQSTETDLERAEHLLALAEISYRRGRYERTVETARRIRRLAPKEEQLPDTREYYVSEKAAFLAADALIQMDDHKRALEMANSGLERYPGGFYQPDLLFLSGVAALKLSENGLAAERFTRMLAEHPDHRNAAFARYYLGYAYFNQTEFAKAIPHFQAVVEEHPDLGSIPDARFRIAEAYYNLEEYEQAAAQYREVMRKHPGHALAEDALYNISWCVMNAAPGGDEEEQQGALKEAVQEYLDQYPGGRHAATARYTLGEIYFNAGDYTKAYDLFTLIQKDYAGSAAAEEAEAVMPQLQEAIAYKHYAEIMKEYNNAVDENDDEKLVELIPELESLWDKYRSTSIGVGAKVNVGVAYQRLERWEEAVAAYDSVLFAGEAGAAEVTPNVEEFAQRRREVIAKKHL